MEKPAPLSEAEIRAEFDRIKASGLSLLNAFDNKAEYYKFRRYFTDLGLCGKQTRADRLARARRYCVSWRLRNKDKIAMLRKEKTDAKRLLSQEVKAKRKAEMEENRKKLMCIRMQAKLDRERDAKGLKTVSDHDDDVDLPTYVDAR